MLILGLGGSVHDFSACIVADGRVIVAIEEERLSRIKHHPLSKMGLRDMRLRAIDYCLDAAGIRLTKIDQVVGNDLLYPGVLREFPQIRTINHHLSHAALAYYTTESLSDVMVMDGFGTIHEGLAETVSYFTPDSDGLLRRLYVEKNKVHLKTSSSDFRWANYDFVENSIGEFYKHVTQAIGFGELEEGKTMGLAPMGRGDLDETLAGIVRIDPDGVIKYGPSERSEVETWIRGLVDSPDDSWEIRAEIAHAAQEVLERSMLRRVRHLKSVSNNVHLAGGGGVFLNSVVNAKIRDAGQYRRFHLHGAAGDSGTAIGASLLWHHMITGVRPPVQDITYTGRLYSKEEIVKALESRPHLDWHEVVDPSMEAARELADGAVIGWFQGGSEFGPRALGNRSILADPSRSEVKAKINSIVKHRESFRPFAPAVLAEHQSSLLDSTDESLYMCINSFAKTEARSQIASAIHTDGSARYQTVTETSNPRFHQLITNFEEITGVPALLNTSFNDREPIIESPEDALLCFERTKLDALFIGDICIKRPLYPRVGP